MSDARPDAAREADVGREWAERAAAWRRWAAPWATQTRAATALIAEAAGVAHGMHVLDVASGPGEPALTLARLVGPRGRVVATDIAPDMVAVAREQAGEAARGNLAVQVADARDLPFAPASFDAVTCRFGIAHVPAYARALGEMRRVLKPGGRAAFVVWGARANNPYFAIVDAVLARYPAPEPLLAGPRAPGPFTFSVEGTLGRALEEAGFRDVREEARAITLTWPGPAESWWDGRRDMSAATTRQLASLPPSQRAEIAAAVVRGLRPYERGGRVELPAVVIVAAGMA